MKKIFFISALFLTAVCSAWSQQVTKSQWDEAVKCYAENDFVKAGQLWEAMSRSEEQSAAVYYNLGNCYFKQDMLGKAILNYNKALLLDPGNDDIRHNLELASTKTKNRIEKVPVFFLKRWFIAFGQQFSSNGWAVLSLLLLAGGLASAFGFISSKRSLWRKLFFSTASTLSLLFIVAVIGSFYQRSQVSQSDGAIVMSNAVAVKSSPADGGTDLFVLNEGAKVQISDQVGEWSEVTIDNGGKGWLKSSEIEPIRIR